MVSTPHFSYVNQWYLCSSCATSESCLGWEGGHPSSPSVVDYPSEQGVHPSGKEVGLWRKASSDGPDWKTKPERCPCGCNTPYKTQRQDLFLIPAKKEKLCWARIEQGKRTNLFLSAFMGGKNDVYYFYLVSFGFFLFFFKKTSISELQIASKLTAQTYILNVWELCIVMSHHTGFQGF